MADAVRHIMGCLVEKPASLRRGLRLESSARCLPIRSHVEKPASLRRGLRRIPVRDTTSALVRVEKPASLRRGLRRFVNAD